MPTATRAAYIQEMAKGNGFYRAERFISHGATITGGAAASGFFTASVSIHFLGTTIPGTLVDTPLPPSPPSALTLASFLQSYGAGSRPQWLCRIYRFVTLNLTATGNQFTHDSTFTRLRRTVLGQASQNIELIPLLWLTSATSTSAAIFRMRTVAGGAGYDDQSGNATVATKTMTMPAAATAINSCFIMRLEDGDNAVLNISNIEVTTSAATGAASIFGVEPLAPVSHIQSGQGGYCDGLFGGLALKNIVPATPDSGVVTSYLALCDITTGNTAAPTGQAYSIFGALAG